MNASGIKWTILLSGVLLAGCKLKLDNGAWVQPVASAPSAAAPTGGGVAAPRNEPSVASVENPAQDNRRALAHAAESAETSSAATPPPPRVEQRGSPPATFGYVWVPGSWVWRNGKWVWIAGRWEPSARRPSF